MYITSLRDSDCYCSHAFYKYLIPMGSNQNKNCQIKKIMLITKIIHITVRTIFKRDCATCISPPQGCRGRISMLYDSSGIGATFPVCNVWYINMVQNNVILHLVYR